MCLASFEMHAQPKCSLEQEFLYTHAYHLVECDADTPRTAFDLFALVLFPTRWSFGRHHQDA